MKMLQNKFAFPDINLRHLSAMTDSTGLFQHAKYNIPDFSEGYCTDDNARALLLVSLLESLGFNHEDLIRIRRVALAFLNFAFDKAKGRFRNFLSFERTWIDEIGSDDSNGRAIWSLSFCLTRSTDQGIKGLVESLLHRSINSITTSASPRAWAYALLGLTEIASSINLNLFRSEREMLFSKLFNKFSENSTADWPWCEQLLTYGNARLPQALISSAILFDDRKALQQGLESLEWLMEHQTSKNGHFSAIGCNGFFPKGGIKAEYDQQPIEACATVGACISAYKATHNKSWIERAKKAFGWYLGKNDLGLCLYDETSGGCRDALHSDKVNQNQGAESTLSYLLSLAELHLNAIQA